MFSFARLYLSHETTCLGVEVPEEFLEGGHVGRLEHTPLLALRGGVPAVGNGSIQNPGQIMTWVLHHTLLWSTAVTLRTLYTLHPENMLQFKTADHRNLTPQHRSQKQVQ